MSERILEQSLIKLVEPIIRHAGELIMAHYGKITSYKIKNDRSILTEADMESEQFLLKALAPLIPGADLVAEEEGEVVAQGSDFKWVIDPLDGTTNFAHGFPYFCISIGLTYRGVPVFGAIYDPTRNELFHAQEGRGAFLGDKPIRVSAFHDISRAVVSAGVPCSRHDCDIFWRNFQAVDYAVHTYRKLGAAALDMSYVASGRLDAALFGRLAWWDIVAGTILVREAGGRVSEFEKDTIGPDFSTCLVTNGLLHENLRSLLS